MQTNQERARRNPGKSYGTYNKLESHLDCSSTAGMAPLAAFVPDSVMEDVFDAFPHLLSSPPIESLRKDDGSFDLKANAS